MFKLFFIVVFFSIPFIAISQTTIKGSVFDVEDNDKIQGAIINVLDSVNETIAFDISTDKGEFVVSFNSELKKINIICRAMGYREELLTVPNENQTLNFKLLQTGIELQEVTIKSKPITISEDTLRYSVNTFKAAGDRTIGDLLKKLPGIEVSESGGIKYQGEPINKFYIEGLDLLENKYGIATNNVPIDAVQNVEVIENHQPIKAIKGMISSAQAAINLKLNEEKTIRPVGGVRVGGGYSDAPNWLMEIFGLQASKKWQTIVMYKTNNVGSDISIDLEEQSFSLKEIQAEANNLKKNIINKPSLSNPSIEKERFLFNKTHTASVNNLWKTGNDSQLRLNFNYLNDARKENTKINSDYFLPDSTVSITEMNTLGNNQQFLDGTLAFTDNSTKEYWDNTLKWKIATDDYRVNTLISGENTYQATNLNSAFVQNQLNYLHRNNDKIINIGSFISFSKNPELLSIHRLSDEELQKVNKTNLLTRTGSYYSWFWRHSSLRISGNIETSSDWIDTKLTSQLFPDSLYSNFVVNNLKLELSPLYTYKFNKFELKAEVPIRYSYYSSKNSLTNNTNDKSNLLFNYKTSIHYTFSPYLNAQLSYRYNQNLGDFSDLLDVYLMKGFRSYYKPIGLISHRKTQSINLSFYYKNPLNNIFANGSIAYIPSVSNKTYASKIIDYQLVGSEVNTNRQAKAWIATLYLGKYFIPIKTNLSITANTNRTYTFSYRQSVLYPFISDVTTTNFKATTKATNWFTVVYSANFLKFSSVIRKKYDSQKTNLDQINQQLKFYISTKNNFELNSQLEYAHNEITPNKYVNMLFTNIGGKYKLKQIDLELYWNNIFNNKEYFYSTVGELENFTYRHSIRPASITGIISFKF